MSTTTTPSAGTAKRIASMKRRAVGVQRRAGGGAGVREVRGDAAVADVEVGDDRRVGLDEGVDAVVGRALQPDRDQRVGLGLGEVLGLDAVEVGADGDHGVGRVPQPPGGLDVGREADQVRVPGRQHAGGAVGRQDGRAEALGEAADGIGGVARAAAGPDQRALGAIDQGARRAQVRRRLDHRGHARSHARAPRPRADRSRPPGRPGAWAPWPRRAPPRGSRAPRSPASARGGRT